MIKFVTGDMFKYDVDAYVNPVNCVGVMGGGLALQFKNKFPRMFEDYVNQCNKQLLLPGRIHSFKEREKWIVNFPTKVHFINSSKIEYIEHGMKGLLSFCQEEQIKSMILPKLGCGLGGLSWIKVKPIIIDGLNIINKDFNIEFFIVE